MATASTSAATYQPGVCNIAHDEVGYRRKAGLLGAFVTAVIAVALFAVGSPWWSQLFLAVPAALAAIGLLQARESFCVRYAAEGKYNVEPGFEHSGEVGAEADRDADRRKSRAMFRQAAAIGVATAAVLAAIAVAAG